MLVLILLGALPVGRASPRLSPVLTARQSVTSNGAVKAVSSGVTVGATIGTIFAFVLVIVLGSWCGIRRRKSNEEFRKAVAEERREKAMSVVMQRRSMLVPDTPGSSPGSSVSSGFRGPPGSRLSRGPSGLSTSTTILPGETMVQETPQMPFLHPASASSPGSPRSPATGLEGTSSRPRPPISQQTHPIPSSSHSSIPSQVHGGHPPSRSGSYPPQSMRSPPPIHNPLWPQQAYPQEFPNPHPPSSIAMPSPRQAGHSLPPTLPRQPSGPNSRSPSPLQLPPQQPTLVTEGSVPSATPVASPPLSPSASRRSLKAFFSGSVFPKVKAPTDSVDKV